MHISVAIVGYRNADDIVRCLAALETSSHSDFGVVICENGGPEAFRELSAVLPARLANGAVVRAILAPGNVGYAGGVNICVEQTPGADAWWILNPDTEPGCETMARLAARLRVGDCDAVGSTIYLPDGRVQSHGGRWRGWLARAESMGHGSQLSDHPRTTDIEERQNYLNGASMMVGRRFVNATGPMQEEYFLYCEEVEWCLRGLKRGMRLGYAADAAVLHHAGTTTGSYASMRSRPKLPIYLNERNKILTTADIFPVRLPVAVVASALLILLRFGRQRAWRQLGYAFQGWAAGLAGARGRPAWLGRQ